MTRRRFWKLVPLLAPLPIVSGWSGAVAGLGFWSVFAITAAAFLPLALCGFARLEDAGEDGQDALTPWIPFSMAAMFGRAGLSIHEWATAAWAAGADGPAGFGVFVCWLVTVPTLSIAVVAATFAFLVRIGPAAGATLLPTRSVEVP